MIIKRTWMTPAALLIATLGLAACDVEQTEEGSLPDVDVEAEGGSMPEYDVDAADVDVGTREKTVTVPDVDVTMPDEEDDSQPRQ